MNTTNKPGVLAVMDAVVALEQSYGDRDEQARVMREARAIVERLAEEAETAALVLRNLLNAGAIHEGYSRQLGDLTAALAAFKGEQS